MTERDRMYDEAPEVEMFGERCRSLPSRMMVDQHYVYKFPNGYGASVIRGRVSFGAWELGVIGKDGHLDYDHPVSQGDVVRGNPEDIAEWLQLIKATP